MTTSGTVASTPTNPTSTNAVSAVRGGGGKGGQSGGAFGDVLSNLQKPNNGAENTADPGVDMQHSQTVGVEATGANGLNEAVSNGNGGHQFLAEMEDALESIAGELAVATVDDGVASNGQGQASISASQFAAVIGAAHGERAVAGADAGVAEGDRVQSRNAAGRGTVDSLARIASVLSGAGVGAVTAGAVEAAAADQQAVRAGVGNVFGSGRNSLGATEPMEPAESDVVAGNLFGAAAAEAATSSEVGLSSRQTLRAQVIKQEAHFPPVMPQAAGGDSSVEQPLVGVEGVVPIPDDFAAAGMRPSQQVAERIGAGIAADGIFARHLAGNGDPTTPKPVLKVLQIQLQPADMGTVTVRMELKNEGLTVLVEASRSDTADLLRSDQDTLTKLLRSAGYAIDATSVRVLDGDRSGSSQQFSQQSGGQAQSQFSSQSQSGASEHQRGRGETDGQAGNQGGQATRNDGNETSAHRSASGLYL